VPPRVCADCHINGNFENMPTTCAGCHGTGATIDPVYATTDAPPHATTPNLFPQSCQTCHTTAGWSPATFPHTGVSFNLSGAHVSPPLACNACHTGTGAGWRITQFACDNCHHADWQGTTNPNHNQLGIPTTCANCHSTNPNWTPVTMNHTGVTGACSACHMPDYNATTSPDHQIQGYPITCSSSGPFTCHTSTTSWTPNGFNPSTTHDSRFPLAHHNSRCNQCHTTSQVFTAFSCISGGCHGQSNTNSDHQGVSGYQYNSNACYNCHPNGQSLQGDRPTRPSKTPGTTRTVKQRPKRKPPVGVPGPGTPAPSPPATRSPPAGHP
jgi:hypothetical protein